MDGPRVIGKSKLVTMNSNCLHLHSIILTKICHFINLKKFNFATIHIILRNLKCYTAMFGENLAILKICTILSFGRGSRIRRIFIYQTIDYICHGCYHSMELFYKTLSPGTK